MNNNQFSNFAKFKFSYIYLCIFIYSLHLMSLQKSFDFVFIHIRPKDGIDTMPTPVVKTENYLTMYSFK